MYKKILVPLDGSQFSESSLEHVKKVAAGPDKTEIVLLMLIDPVSYYAVGELAAANTKMASYIESKMEKAGKAKALEYVGRIAETLRKDGFAVTGDVIMGKLPADILAYAENNQIDLIVMSTHRRSGISRWAFGSVAEAVQRRSTVPVLVVSPLSSVVGV